MRNMIKMLSSKVSLWVDEMARLTKPDQVLWLDGSDQEYVQLLAEGVQSCQLIPLNNEKQPGSFLHRSNPFDVARTEQSTFVCTSNKEEVGPNNNWMPPAEAFAKLRPLFDGVMRGRKMYVIAYLLGPKGSPFSKVGLELTDSIYVAVNMRIMTQMGKVALEQLGDSSDFIKGLHSMGTLDPKNRWVCHFPEEGTVWSINSGYGGNALLSKKCTALRIASWLGKQEGWLAEHMLIMGVEDPKGKVTYISAAFPSACGKTNLAMLKPTELFNGYRIWCIGDDIAWLRIGADGQLYAANPESGFFGVAPGTNSKTNPNMMQTISRNTLFTNVALAADQTVWWEGLELPREGGLLDWKGQPWTPGSDHLAAHPNSRFTTPIQQCPIYSPEWGNPRGVPISAILFGCRRSTLIPLISESLSWQHGVYYGATLRSETTAAAAGATGIVRNDPMAMLPFCGYNMANYFSHWLEIGTRLKKPPKIFRVNWFRRDSQRKFIWPGFGENMRVLQWIIDRCEGRGTATETPLGFLPTADSLNIAGLSLDKSSFQEILSVDREGWLEETQQQKKFFDSFGDCFPAALRTEQEALLTRLK